jgi:hypothetical protein
MDLGYPNIVCEIFGDGNLDPTRRLFRRYETQSQGRQFGGQAPADVVKFSLSQRRAVCHLERHRARSHNRGDPARQLFPGGRPVVGPTGDAVQGENQDESRSAQPA